MGRGDGWHRIGGRKMLVMRGRHEVAILCRPKLVVLLLCCVVLPKGLSSVLEADGLKVHVTVVA